MDYSSLLQFDPGPVMQKAIQLALKAQFQTEPNPIVGAILVDQKGEILSEGFHERAGAPHAEVMALKPYETAPEGSILFVTLEPCSHHGRTPPCVDLILKKKVKTVVVGCQDPNPKVAGNGLALLKRNGVQVITGICEGECVALNPVFNKNMLQNLPYVSLKAGTSLDGKIAMPSGESQWITCELSRSKGHLLRSQHQAMAVGSNTLRFDNPRLTDRISAKPRQPARIVFSSNGDIPIDSHFINDHQTKRFLVTGSELDSRRQATFEEQGITILKGETPQPEIESSLARLYQLGICSLLVEGGGQLIASFMRSGMVDRICLFLSGKVIGAQAAPNWCGELGLANLADLPRFSFDQVEKLGDDLFITGSLKRSSTT